MKVERKINQQIITVGDVDGGAIKHPIVNLKIPTAMMIKGNHSINQQKGVNG
jgi:hypothetical protein